MFQDKEGLILKLVYDKHMLQERKFIISWRWNCVKIL